MAHTLPDLTPVVRERMLRDGDHGALADWYEERAAPGDQWRAVITRAMRHWEHLRTLTFTCTACIARAEMAGGVVASLEARLAEGGLFAHTLIVREPLDTPPAVALFDGRRPPAVKLVCRAEMGDTLDDRAEPSWYGADWHRTAREPDCAAAVLEALQWAVRERPVLPAQG